MKREERINDPTLALLQAFQGLQAGLWTALPAKIQEVGTDMTVSCLPTIQAQYTDTKGEKTLITMPLLIKCPLLFPSAGGFSLTVPVKPGDDVLVIFASRAIDSWWQSGGVQPPAELRMHDLSDGFAFPGPKAVPDSFTQHANNVQLRKNDGTALIEITPAGVINITTTAAVHVTAGGDATVNAGGNVALTAAGDATLTAQNINLVGNVAASGGTFTHNSKDVGYHHKHSGVSTGGGTTGNPV